MGHYLRGLNILRDDNKFGDSSLDRFGRFVCTFSKFSGVFCDLQKLIGLVNGLFWNLESYVNGFLCHPDSLSSASRLGNARLLRTFRQPMQTTLNMARRPMRRRYVTSTAKATGTTKDASTGCSKAEAEEAADEERALRDFRLDDEAEE